MAEGRGAVVSVPWAVRLPPSSAPAAGALRLRTDVRVAEAGDWLWLRGDQMDAALDLELRKIPGARRYTVNPDGSVTEVGRRLPAADLPRGGAWPTLSSWLAPRPQPAALAGLTPARAPLRVERGGGERPADVLVTTAAAFAHYAAGAPAARLRRLRFAAASDGRAVIMGEPLPPLPGRRYSSDRGVAVPCGFVLSPRLDAAVLRPLLGLSADGDLALFHDDGSYERVDALNFARAARGTARATRDALAAGGAPP